MFASFSPKARGRTLLHAALAAALAGGAFLVGIDDNALGILLAVLASANLVLAFAHPLDASGFRRLLVGAAAGFVGLVVLGIALSMLIEFVSLPGTARQVLEIAATGALLAAAFLLMPAFVVGVIGFLTTRRRQQARRDEEG